MAVNYEIWDHRFDVLTTKMKKLHDDLGAASPDKVDRLEDIRELVTCLRIYATGMYKFFRVGFETGLDLDGSGIKKLITTNWYPQEHAFRSVINQGYEDLKLYEHIFKQRSSLGNINALDVADRLAWDALQPALPQTEGDPEEDFMPKDTTVLSYFHKFAQIRIIPYAPVALIGLPFSALKEPLDLLAIPHEVGHYVFRRSVIKTSYRDLKTGQNVNYGRPLRNFLSIKAKNQANYVKDWLEEIFADFYGCLIAGPIIALDFQDLQLQFSKKRFVMNDKEHPSPIIRPHIYNHILKHHSPHSKEWTEILENLWVGRRKQRLASEENTHGLEQAENKLNNDEFKTGSVHVSIETALPREQASNSRGLGWLLDKIKESLGSIPWENTNWWQQLHNPELPTGIDETSSYENIEPKVEEKLYNNLFRDKFNLTEEGEIVDLKDPPPPCPNLQSRNINKYLNVAELEKVLHLWPKLFFPDHSHPVRDENREEHSELVKGIWWVWDVLFRAGWNTFGNGDWLKGP